jgi:cyclopropane fatty-acyl-phospholipid synthase-like methyltransferase
VKMKGLGVRVGDYREPIGVFENAFDRVTVFGSTEHNCSSRVRHMGVKVYRERCNDLRARLFALVRSYLRPGGKMFVATLVRNENYALTPLDHCQAYVMDRFYGGRYSHFSEYTRALLRAGFDIDDIKDTTADYHFSAIADADYFGCFKIKWHEDTANKLGWVWRSVALDPFWVHKWLYYCCDTWQWQFGSSCKTSEPLTAAEVRGRAIAQNKHYLCSIP